MSTQRPARSPRAPAAAKKAAKKTTSGTRRAPPRPVRPGSLPHGREEERRGHSLPNDPRTMGPKDVDDAALGAPLGREESRLHGVHDV